MINIRGDQVVTITGIRGSGKSHLLNKIVRATDKYLIYDVMHEHNISDAIIVTDLKILRLHLAQNHKKLIYRPNEISITEFDWICSAIYRQGNRVLFVEEANRVIPNRQITKNVSKLIDLGRHRKAGMVCTTRRIALLDKLPVSQSEHLIIFKTILPNDIKYLKEFIGDIAEKAKSLHNHKFLYHNNNETVLHNPI